MELNILLVPKFHTHRQRTLELTPDSNLTILHCSSLVPLKNKKI